MGFKSSAGTGTETQIQYVQKAGVMNNFNFSNDKMDSFDRSKFHQRKQFKYCHIDLSPLDKYLYCESCYDIVYEYCAIHGQLLIVPDKKVTSRAGIPQWVPLAALTTPAEFLHIATSSIPGAGLGVFSSVALPRGVRFGPYRGKPADGINSMYCWQVQTRDNHTFVDGEDGDTSNWMRYVNCSRNWDEQNLVAYQFQGHIYYRTVKTIPKFTELLVFYGSRFASALGINLKDYNNLQKYIIDKYDDSIPKHVGNNFNSRPDFNTEIMEISEDTTVDNTDIQKGNKVELASNPIEQGNSVILCKDKNTINTNINVDKGNNRKRTKIMCEICNKTVLPNSFKRHKRTHNIEYLFCSLCSYKTTINYSLQIHIQNHKKDANYACDKCTYLTCNKKYFRRHYKDAHKTVLHVHYNLEKFNQKVKGETYSFNCSKCIFKTNDEDILMGHLETHKSDTYQCDTCGYVSTVRKNFTSHIKRVHSKKATY